MVRTAGSTATTHRPAEGAEAATVRDSVSVRSAFEEMTAGSAQLGGTAMRATYSAAQRRRAQGAATAPTAGCARVCRSFREGSANSAPRIGSAASVRECASGTPLRAETGKVRETAH